MLFHLIPFLEGGGLVTGEGTAHAEIYLSAVCHSICLKLVRDCEVCECASDILPGDCGEASPTDLDARIHALNDLKHLKGNGFSLSITI